MMVESRETQVFCERCNTSFWFETAVNDKGTSSGVYKKSLIHNDHVLVCSIDGNGSVRAAEVVYIEHNPLQLLTDDVAQGLHYLNGEVGDDIVIDFYTSNTRFKQFIQTLIIKMFEQATSKRIEEKYKFKVTTFKDRTELTSDRINISVGPYIHPNFDEFKNPIKGIIFDMEEAETNMLDIEKTMDDYNWAAIFVARDKKEGYHNALSSLFEKKGRPFYIDNLSNKSIKELFDFIFAVTLETQYREE